MTEIEITIENHPLRWVFSLAKPEFDALLYRDEPLALTIGATTILALFNIHGTLLTLELAQIDGHGEAALLAVSEFANRLCEREHLTQIEWQVHAIYAAQPNEELRRVLDAQEFEVKFIANIGEVYHKISAAVPTR